LVCFFLTANCGRTILLLLLCIPSKFAVLRGFGGLSFGRGFLANCRFGFRLFTCSSFFFRYFFFGTPGFCPFETSVFACLLLPVEDRDFLNEVQRWASGLFGTCPFYVFLLAACFSTRYIPELVFTPGLLSYWIALFSGSFVLGWWCFFDPFFLF